MLQSMQLLAGLSRISLTQNTRFQICLFMCFKIPVIYTLLTFHFLSIIYKLTFNKRLPTSLLITTEI